MDVYPYIDEFLKQNHKYSSYSKIVGKVLAGGQPYSLNCEGDTLDSEYLPERIRECVQAYTSNKDTAIALFKDFVAFLEKKGVPVPEIEFPPIPVSNTFERLMYIAKYIQDDQPISKLPDILWISSRQIEDDLSRLRGLKDPIQVCGKMFYIPDESMTRSNGVIRQDSTAHPIFLAENLSQVLIMLKGLKAMAENELFQPYAETTAGEIWNQLSVYAKNRLRFVLRELLSEDTDWYDALSDYSSDNHFHTEKMLGSSGANGIFLNALKNGETFCVEYEENGKTRVYKDCRIVEYPHDFTRIPVECSAGKVYLNINQVVRSAYSVEDLLLD